MIVLVELVLHLAVAAAAGVVLVATVQQAAVHVQEAYLEGGDMRIKRKHNRTQAEAKQRLVALADQMGMELQWVDDQSATGSMTINGVTVTGAASVSATDVTLDVELPRLARMFTSRIQKQVEK